MEARTLAHKSEVLIDDGVPPLRVASLGVASLGWCGSGPLVDIRGLRPVRAGFG